MKHFNFYSVLFLSLAVLCANTTHAHDNHYGKIEVKATGGGTVYIQGQSNPYTWSCGESENNDSKTVTIGATANEGYSFSQWNDGNKSATRSVSLKATSKEQGNPTTATYTASFSLNSYNLTWDLAGGEIVSEGTPAGSVPFGTALTPPTVSKEGVLFEGWDPAVPATMPASDVTYTAVWVSKYTTSFSELSKSELLVGETATITLTNVSDNGPAVVSTPGEEEFYVIVTPKNAATCTRSGNILSLTPTRIGEINITLCQVETETLSGAEKNYTLNVLKKPNTISVTLNGVATTSAQMSYNAGIPAVVTATNSSKPVLYEQVEGSAIATYYPDQNAIYTMPASGTAQWRFWQEEDDEYQAAPEVIVTITVTKPNHNVPFTYNKSLYDDGTFTTSKSSDASMSNQTLTFGDESGGGFNWKDKNIVIHFEGVPDKISFQYQPKTTIPASTCTNGKFYVQESSDGSSWNETWSFGVGDNQSKQSTSFALQSSTRYLKIGYTANFSGIFYDISVSELKYLDVPTPASTELKPYDFGAEALGSDDDTQSFNINWANTAPLTVTCSDPVHFAVTPSSFAQYGQVGSQSIDVTYHRSLAIAQHGATITMTNGVYTQYIYVKGETTKKKLSFAWHEALSSTGFVMNVGETYPTQEVPYIAKLALEEENEKVTFTTSDDKVIAVSQDGKSLSAVGVGTCVITAVYPGSDQYDALNSEQTFTVDDKIKQTITWNDNLMGLKWGDAPITLSATASSGGTITYSLQEGSANCVSLSGENNSVLTISNSVAGEAYIVATQAGGEIGGQDYFPITMVKRVIVRDPASQCDDYALAGQSCTFKTNLTNPQTYDLAGTPTTTLTFSAYHDKFSGSWSFSHEYQPLIIEQYSLVNNIWTWNEVFKQVVNEGSAKNYSATISSGATKIRVKSSEEAPHHVFNLTIKRAKFMTSSISSMVGKIDMQTLYSKEIKINHSNIDVMSIEATGDFSEANLSTNTLGAGCGSFGEDAFTFSFTPAEARVYSGSIIISDGKADETKVEIPIELTAQAISQTIIDFTSEPQTILTTDEIEFAGRVLTGNPVYYTSSDSTIAIPVGNKLQIIKGGEVTITAHCDAVGSYGAAPDINKVITINRVPTEITVAPTSTYAEVSVDFPLNMLTLQGGEAQISTTQQPIEGSFAVTAGDLSTAGEHPVMVTFTPKDDNIYAPSTTTIIITVVEEYVPLHRSLVWEAAAENTVYTIDTVELNAKVVDDNNATAGEVAYAIAQSSTEGCGQLVDTTLTFAKAGQVTINATVADDPVYVSVEPVSKVWNVVITPTEITTAPTTMAEVVMGTTLADLTLEGGAAQNTVTNEAVEGTFAITDGDLSTVGTHDLTVTFTPNNTDMYATTTTTISISVIVVLQPTVLTWTVAPETIYLENETELFEATSNREGEIVYSIEQDEEIVLLDYNVPGMIYLQAIGTFTIKATQAATDIYEAATIEKTVVVKKMSSPTGLQNNPATSKAKKVMINNQIVILHEGGMYSITGQKIK